MRRFLSLRPRTELTRSNWLEKVSGKNSYTLCSLKIGDSLPKLVNRLGNTSEIKSNLTEEYQVHYYAKNSSKIGVQIIDSKISGFTLLNKDGISLSDILKQLGEMTGKTPMIGPVFSMWDYEIDGFIYDYDTFNLKVKLDKEENVVSTFYFGKYWTKISLETFPSEIY